MPLLENAPGGYRFLTGISPYSAGVVALPGFALIRIQLPEPLPYLTGFDLIGAHLAAVGRPKAALCAIELRIPQPLPFDGFAKLNAGYRGVLTQWDLLVGDHNPIARTNVAPVVAAPEEASLYAFTYTVPAPAGAPATFVVAGAGDLRDQADLRPEAIVRPGESSAAALQVKAGVVMNVMEERLYGLEREWAEVAAVNIYTPHPPSTPFVSAVLPKLGPAAIHGVHWYFSRPPIAGLEFEMDLRRVWRDQLLV
jgi:hypothetical protein